MLLLASNVLIPLFCHLVLIPSVFTSHPVNKIPHPPLAIFQHNEKSFFSQCHPLLDQVIESNYRDTNLMKLAVCLHQINLIDEAMELYTYIHQEYPDYSFVLANIALLRLTAGEPHHAKALLGKFFQQVGGIYGDETSSILDRDAKLYGPVCIPTSPYKSDCVYALNMYASVHIQLANNSFALLFYKRALELADENDSSLSNIYANLGDLHNNLGDEDAAADFFIKAFWKSFQEEKINPVRKEDKFDLDS